MRISRTRHIQILTLYLLLATGLGFLLGEIRWALILALALYGFWMLRQTLRLHSWLLHPEADPEPPESHGLWGELFDGLYRIQKQHRRDQEQQQQLIRRIQESTNSLRDGVVMTDSRGTLEWWNSSAEYLLGLKAPVDRGQLIHNLIRVPEFKQYFEAKHYADPLELASPARSHLTLQIEINLFGDSDRLLTVKDVSRLHHLEAMRRDFVSNVSHEMRTPLTVITGYLETLAGQADSLPPRWPRALQAMSRQADRLQGLVTDLILLSRLEADSARDKQQTVVMAPLLRAIQEDGVHLSGNRRHEIELLDQGPQRLVGEESQLRSAFSNLLFNAVRYTPDGGRIRLRWWSDPNGAHFSVEDSGDGIDPVHIPRLTERFYRADPSRHQDSGGTGLGLAIVKHALRNHDGELEIHSEIGVGSTFTCHFPPERIASAGGSGEAAEAGPGTDQDPARAHDL